MIHFTVLENYFVEMFNFIPQILIDFILLYFILFSFNLIYLIFFFFFLRLFKDYGNLYPCEDDDVFAEKLTTVIIVTMTFR